MNRRELTAQLKAKAYELGFHAVGVTSAEQMPSVEQALNERIKSGYISGYGFSSGNISNFTNPAKALPGAKSVVAVALSYFQCDDDQPIYIARFARGQDYHKVVSGKLKELAEWLNAQYPEKKTFICVDTGPVLDRALAWKSGIGSYGKNALIYVPEYGSWVVLGEILTDIDLESDQPADLDFCGDCDICIQSCPTGAIAAPYIINANRCISHLTQMKGIIPRDLRPLIGETIYGCDICQKVCPHNSNVRETDVPEFKTSLEMPYLIDILGISPQDYNKKIKHTTMGWIKRSNLRRNAAVALGNLGYTDAVPSLKEALNDPEAIVRAHAAWALGRIGTPAALNVLVEARTRETDTLVIDEISAFLSE